MKRTLTVLLGLALIIQAQTALGAENKQHPAIPGEQDCSECHTGQEKAWFAGKHGLMGVKCIVCHGSTEKNFTSNPGLAACRGCHADQVAQVMKGRGKETKKCVTCHDRHELTVKSGTVNPYHAQGDKKP